MLKENDSLVQVKICGLTSMDDVHIIEKYGADYAGMVLYYPKSRRNIDINLAAVLVAQLKKSDIKSVAVVVSPDVSQLEARANAYAATEWVKFDNKYMRHDIGKTITK